MKLSVIIPQSLNDLRGQFEFIESWCRQTGVAPEDYEIVIAVNDRDESAVRRCRELVRPQDRVIPFHGENDLHYYEPAIAAARGRVLLLTENHVVADERCVAEVIAFFERPDVRSAFVSVKHINSSRFARHEGELYDRQVSEVFLQPDCWDRVHLRGFAIEREVLSSVGGVPWQYELFCAPLLGLRLLRASIPIGYCDGAVIHHVNVSRPRFLQYEIGTYIEHEYRYRDERHFEDDELLLGTSEILDQRKLWVDNLIGKGASAITSALVSAIWNKLAGRPKRSVLRRRTLLATALRWRIAAALGLRMLLWKAHFNLVWNRLRYACLQFSEEQGNRAHEALWSAMADLWRARYCAAHPRPPAARGTSSFGESIRNQSGFHGLEEWQGHCFRWSEPAALLSLQLAAGDSEICIDTGRIRGAKCEFRFELYFNGRRIERDAISIGAGCIRFPVLAGALREDATQELLILTEPLELPPDGPIEHRQLGMPVRSVSCRSVSGTVPLASPPAPVSLESDEERLQQAG